MPPALEVLGVMCAEDTQWPAELQGLSFVPSSSYIPLTQDPQDPVGKNVPRAFNKTVGPLNTCLEFPVR